MKMLKIIDSFDSAVDVLRTYSPYLSSLRECKIDICTMANKLLHFGTIIELCDADQRIGFAGFYNNDKEGKIAFISLIAIKSSFEGKGYGSILLRSVEEICIESGMKMCRLEVDMDNLHAIQFYKKNNYMNTGMSCGHSLIMEKKLSNHGGKQ